MREWKLSYRVQWVKDLLSGEFRQGRNALKSVSDGKSYYCCLGVLCERVNPEARELKIDLGRSVGFMENDTLRLVGISDVDQSAAVQWNDSDLLKFDRIADLVAWGTQHNIAFLDISPGSVPIGYATEWLKQFDS